MLITGPHLYSKRLKQVALAAQYLTKKKICRLYGGHLYSWGIKNFLFKIVIIKKYVIVIVNKKSIINESHILKYCFMQFCLIYIRNIYEKGDIKV